MERPNEPDGPGKAGLTAEELRLEESRLRKAHWKRWGPFVLAHLRVFGDAALAQSFLEPFAHHLKSYGLGTLGEIFDGDPPFTPRGCFAQAWTVAEVLRAWHATAFLPGSRR